MKIIITHQSNSISFEIEENLPEHEAFEVLRAFTVSAFENLPDPLVYSLSGVSEPFLLQDPKDWKEGLQNHFRGSVTLLEVVDNSSEAPEADSDDSDSYVHITDKGEEKPATKVEAKVAKPAEPAVADEKADDAVIEDYDSEAELEDKQTDEEVEPKEDDATENNAEEAGEEQPSPRALCKRVKEFLVEVGTEGLQNIAAVAYSLVTEGNVDLSDAIRTAVETSEKAANHPLTKDLLAILDVYMRKFQACNWTHMLTQFNIDQIVALIPGIVEALTRSMEGADNVELDLSPLMSQMCPMLAHMQSFMQPGEERVFRADPANPCGVFQQAREHMQAEYPQQDKVTHRGITCDGCGMSPIVGVRYKSVLRADYDLCENCEVEHDPKDPLIKIKTPVEDMEVLPGLSEFRRAVAAPGGRGRRCRGRFGRGRGWHCGPRRGRGCHRPCGPGHRMKHFARMFQNSPFAAAMENHPLAAAMRAQFCQPEEPAAPVDHRDPARQPEEPVETTDERKQKKKEMKQKVKALKKEAKAIRKEQKKLEKRERKAKKQAKKEAKKMRKQLDCEVTGHLDMEETSQQVAGAIVLKTWKVKNTGSVAWPESTMAVFHTGNESVICPGYEVIQVGAVEPNDVAYIRCMLSVPEVEGSYSLTYRLSDSVVGKFGGRLMTQIDVMEKPAQKEEEPVVAEVGIPQAIDLAEAEIEAEERVMKEPSAPAPAPKEPAKPFEFQKQKEQLKMMGFDMDDETLDSVLVACKGDIGQAISLLM